MGINDLVAEINGKYNRENLDNKDKKDNQDVEDIKQSAPELYDIMKRYVSCLATISKTKSKTKSMIMSKTKEKARFQQDSITPFCKYIRFKKGCCAAFAPIPKDEMATLIGKTDKDIEFLLTKTDLSDEVLDLTDINEKNLPILALVNKYIDFPQIKSFLEAAERFLVIPDLGFMSYFIEDGHVLREYMQFKGDIRLNDQISSFLFCIRKKAIHYRQNKRIDLFDAASLRAFSEKTGTLNIKKMYVDAILLFNTLEEYQSSTATKRIENIRNVLYERLKRHSPELVYKDGNK